MREWLSPLNPFSRPSALKLASDELEEAQRELLRAQTSLDYARRVTEYHQDRIKRSTAFVKAALEHTDPPTRSQTMDAPRDPQPHAERALSRTLHTHGIAWGDQAQALFLAFGMQRAGQPFLTEQAAAYAYQCGLPLPPDGRAWRAVVTQPRRANQITGNGYAPAHNYSPKTVWRVLAGARA